MIKELSILIPVYNDCVVDLVRRLQAQAQAISGLEYEVLAVDDGSTDYNIIARNEAINAIPCCRYVRCNHSVCRSAMRNRMVRQGRYDWHLMIDARLTICNDDFILRYLESGAHEGEVVCGGVCVDGRDQSAHLYSRNLRFRYEKTEENKHSLHIRQKSPYRAFRTTNFFYHRMVLMRVPYDERIMRYGYEDVMLGKKLCMEGIKVLHIDNPVVYTHFETNDLYIKKMDDALTTLCDFKDELVDYSPILSVLNCLKRFRLVWIIVLWHRLFTTLECRNLTGRHPKLFVLKLYKLGFVAGKL